MDIKKIGDLEKAGYTGCDVSLSISLLEYGMAWKKEGKDYKFLYRFEPVANLFDWGCLNKNTEVFKEFSWIGEKDWNSIFSYLGTSREEWSKRELPDQISDLYRYWGAENIFGGSMSGFLIEE